MFFILEYYSYKKEHNFFNPSLSKSTLANSEDPDEMPHNAAFQQGLLCLLKLKGSCDPSEYTMDHSKFILSKQKEESMTIRA